MRNFVVSATFFCILKIFICSDLNADDQKITEICCHLNGHLTCKPPEELTLDISYKKLKKLPFCEKSNLAIRIQKLDLDNNNITEHDFDKVFVTFRNLSSLLMFNNDLSVLSGNRFKEPNKLLLLDLGCNKIYRINVDFFTAFEQLEDLKLGKNRLANLTSGVFRGLKNLRRIDLSSNFLTVFRMDWFDRRIPLTSIHMGNNKVSVWEPFDFTWPKTMKQLNFSGNHLPAILPLPLSHSDNDKEWSVDLLKNPLFCGCRQKSHKEHFANEDVACRLRLECPDGSFNIIPDTKCKNGQFITKDWLSEFVKKPLCIPPKVKGYKEKTPNKAMYDISCTAVGFPPPEVNIKSEQYNFTIVPQEANKSEFVVQVALDENHASIVACEAVNIFGSDVQRVLFIQAKNEEPGRNNMLLLTAALSSSLSLLLACVICVWGLHLNDFLISKYD